MRSSKKVQCTHQPNDFSSILGQHANGPTSGSEIKQEPNKSGDGVGQWSAWKGMKLAKEYEAQGGNYENEAGSKNEPKKGKPKAKTAETKREEEQAQQDSEPSEEE